MSEFTIGQYYPENSIIHRLDPRVKLFGTLVFIVMLFVVNNFIGFGLMALYLFVVVKMSKIPFRKVIKGVRGIIIILIVSALLNMFFTPGKTAFSWWIFSITYEGLVRSAFLIVRLVLLVLSTSIMTLTTKPNDLSDGLEKSLGFLKVIRVPVHEIAMIMSLALRFIPTLMEETERIKKAQMARGADFETGNMFRRAKSLIPILIPLFVSSIKRAVNLAQAMEARCYNGGNRTKLNPLKYKRRDAMTYIFCGVIIASVIVVNVLAVKFLGNTFVVF
ncbi:MAG: energy-coupling factor transporter transmembrane protein EcfT [Eubacterium sp.]|nr:energy-coupling factor transporter transmembrane protein EcfT [Eubacterium sp.]